MSTLDAVETKVRIGEFDGFLAGDVIDIDLEGAHPGDALLEHFMHVFSLIRRVLFDQEVCDLMLFCDIFYDPCPAEDDNAAEIGGVLLRHDLVGFDDGEAHLSFDRICFLFLDTSLKSIVPVSFLPVLCKTPKPLFFNAHLQDLLIRIDSAVSVELKDISGAFDFVQIQLRHKSVLLVPFGFGDDVSPWV